MSGFYMHKHMITYRYTSASGLHMYPLHNHIYTWASDYICMHIPAHTHSQAHITSDFHIYSKYTTNICLHMYTHSWTSTHICIHTYTDTLTNMATYTHIYIWTFDLHMHRHMHHTLTRTHNLWFTHTHTHRSKVSDPSVCLSLQGGEAETLSVTQRYYNLSVFQTSLFCVHHVVHGGNLEFSH